MIDMITQILRNKYRQLIKKKFTQNLYKMQIRSSLLISLVKPLKC